MARTWRRSPAGSLPTGQIDPERILTGTCRPPASTTETLASDSPTGAVVTAASASGDGLTRAAGHQTVSASRPAPARRSSATSATSGARLRLLGGRRRDGYWLCGRVAIVSLVPKGCQERSAGANVRGRGENRRVPTRPYNSSR